jgi:hypothetical protein
VIDTTEGRHVIPSETLTSAAELTRSEPTVLYIAGSGRSGSTLLERMLGSLPGFINVGELNDLFRRVLKYDERCGCGLVFSACPFWTAVGDRAFGGWDAALIEEVPRLHMAVARQRYLRQLMYPATRSESFEADLRRYTGIHRRLYAAALAESGASVVVDASKGAAQALASSRGGGVDMCLLHLVRDARGVAFSWAKSDVARPHGREPGSTMSHFTPSSTAARWALLQGEIAVARRFVNASALVRYEDLVRNPAAEIARATAAVGLPVDDAALGHIDGQTVDLPLSHGLSGNPSRFRAGRQQLRLDEQWRRDMSRWNRIAATAIAAGPLGRYGYLSVDSARRPS